jgi:uncharacterized protein (DUF1778 family)
MTRPRQARHGAPNRKDSLIEIQASPETKAILSRAAALRGQTLPEFILDSARCEAEEALLNQRVFVLDAAAHERFIEVLDNPKKPSKKLRQLMRRVPPWPR